MAGSLPVKPTRQSRGMVRCGLIALWARDLSSEKNERDSIGCRTLIGTSLWLPGAARAIRCRRSRIDTKRRGAMPE